MRRHRSWYRVISPVVVLVVWQLISASGLVSQQKLPSPTTVLHTAVSLITGSSAAYGTLQGAMAVSLERVAVGFVLGGGTGLILALLAGLSRLGENSVDLLLQMLRTLPLFGLIPVFIVWFGIGELPKVLTPTGTWCEDAWLVTAALTRKTSRLKFLVAFRPGLTSPTLAAQMAAIYQRLSGGRLLLNVVTGSCGPAPDGGRVEIPVRSCNTITTMPNGLHPWLPGPPAAVRPGGPPSTPASWPGPEPKAVQVP